MEHRWNLSVKKFNAAIEAVKANHLEASSDAYEDAYHRMEDR